MTLNLPRPRSLLTLLMHQTLNHHHALRPSSSLITTCQLPKECWIITNLQEVQNAVKEDHALNKKVLEAVEAYTKNSKNLIELLTLAKSSASMARSVGPQMTRIENT
ncbi:hypothetical protein Tco_0735309 [Tanacetum coccineum]